MSEVPDGFIEWGIAAVTGAVAWVGRKFYVLFNGRIAAVEKDVEALQQDMSKQSEKTAVLVNSISHIEKNVERANAGIDKLLERSK